MGFLKEFAFDGKELFDKPDNARLRKEELLNEVGAFLERYPFGAAVVVVNSGSIGKKEEGVKLSQERAMAVRRYLARKFKLDDARIKTRVVGDAEQGEGSGAGRVAILVYAGKEGVLAQKKK